MRFSNSCSSCPAVPALAMMPKAMATIMRPEQSLAGAAAGYRRCVDHDAGGERQAGAADGGEQAAQGCAFAQSGLLLDVHHVGLDAIDAGQRAALEREGAHGRAQPVERIDGLVLGGRSGTLSGGAWVHHKPDGAW